MAVFGELQRGGYLPDLIVAELSQQITDGQLQPGDHLPTETALAADFGVSRNVVREAIARLRSDGLIATKQGRGACVLPVSARSTFRIDMNRLGQGDRLAALFELRGVLEIEAAGMAALRRSDSDVAAINAALVELRGHANFNAEQLEADAKFHRALGTATHNEYLASIMDYLSGRLKETTRATKQIYKDSDLLDVTVAEHQAILDAVVSQDSQAARAAMSAHIRGAAERLGVPVPQNLS